MQWQHSKRHWCRRGDVPDEASEVEALLAVLRELYRDGDRAMRARWDRSLPFADTVLDRWERAEALGFGEGASVYNSALVYGGVTAGERTWVGPQVLLDGSGGGLSIGSYCSISAGVQIYTHDTVRWSLSGGHAEREVSAVRIGNRCHVGAGSVIAPGSTIGDGCVVGALSFVQGRVASGTVVAGAPARPIGVVRGSGADVALDTSARGRQEAVELSRDGA